jgi:hypothetical protein
LFALVERVAAGSAAPSDLDVSWQCHFIDADAGVVLVPFTLALKGRDFTAYPVAMYVRVVLKGAPAPAPGPNDALAQYPFEDAAIFAGPSGGRLSRAFTAPPGTYDVYIGLAERPETAQSKPRTAVIKQELTIPDLKSGLTTSSVIVAERVEPDAASARATYEDQLDDPYRLWGSRITPAIRRSFRPDERLSVLFVVYQASAAGDGKPDVTVAYSIHSTASADTAPVATTEPETFSAATLPLTFDMSRGDLIVAGREVPLNSLAAGPYRLEIVVTDRVARASVRRVVPFSIEP